jgi:hypothetical protein|tara:strand:+ start:63 stop:677 length:615 start_codon:yes stop_codon:yes gene_type:complete
MTNNKKAVIFSDGKIKRFEKIVKQQTDEKKRELNRSLDNKVDDVFDKKYTLFLKDIKVKKDLDILKKASDELEVFERQLEDKKRRLKDAVKIACKKVNTICQRQAKINNWNSSFYGGYDDDYSDYNSKLENICREEITKQLRKSTKEGQELDAIDNKVNNLLMTLSYPNLVASEVDLNKALEDGSSMLSIALNPNTLKRQQIEG